MVAVGSTAAVVVAVVSALAGIWTGAPFDWQHVVESGKERPHVVYSGDGARGGGGGSSEQSQFGTDVGAGDVHQQGAFMPVSVSCQCPSVDCACAQCPNIECACAPVECSCACGEMGVGGRQYNGTGDYSWSELFREPGFFFSWLSWGSFCGLLPRCLSAAFRRRDGAAPPPAISER